MSTSANFASVPRRSSALLRQGDQSRIGGTSVPAGAQLLFGTGASGSRVDRIELDGIGPTVASIVRLWVHDGTNVRQSYEVPVLAITPSSTSAAWQVNLDATIFPDMLPIILPAAAGSALYATVHDTQVALAESQTSVAASQSIAANGYAVLATAAAAAAICASATAGAAAFKTLTTAPFTQTNPFQLTITSASNNSTVNYIVRGVSALGAVVTETIAGPNATTVYSTNVWQSITSIFVSGAEAGASTIGTASLAALAFPANVTISSTVNLSAVNFTITGLNSANVLTTETLAGPAAGATVTSVNTYRLVTSVKASGAANPTLIGNAVALGGIAVHAQGGDF